MGLRAVSNIFHRHPDAARPDADILRLLEICLVNNNFQFDSRVYLQMEGTAMGQRYALSYANIYMSIYIHIHGRERRWPVAASVLSALLG